MRATVTLDPDTRFLVKRRMRSRGGTFEEVVNAAMRRGLLMETAAAEEPEFVVEARSMGLRVQDPKELRQINNDFEVERFVRVTRQLEEDSE